MLSTQRTPQRQPPAPADDPVDELLSAAVDEAPTPAPERAVPEAPALPPPSTTAETQTPGLEFGHDFDFEGPLIHDGVPDVPPIIQRKLDRNQLASRWLSAPHVQKRGLRMYTTYSPTPEDRDAINLGHCHPGINISADNRVTWGEDAFLATIPKRVLAMREAARRKASLAQAQLAKSHEALQEQARRLGTKVKLSVSEHQSAEL